MEPGIQKKVNEESVDSLSSVLSEYGQEDAAKHIIQLMHNQHILILKLANDKESIEVLSDTVCQHIAELGLKEIVDIIKSVPISNQHYYAGAVLVAIKDIHIVKKYLWRDKEFLPAMTRLLQFSHNNVDINPLLRDIVACVVQGLLLGGTPHAYYESIGQSDLIELFANMFKHKLEVCFINSYEELMMSLMLLCQNNETCVKKCKELGMSAVLDNFSSWEKLDCELKEKACVASACIKHMGIQDELPDHKKMLLSKFSNHMTQRNKSCKRMEKIVCSYTECGKEEPDTTAGRFKKCARCRIAVYCSKDCQRAHWKIHSKHCIAPDS